MTHVVFAFNKITPYRVSFFEKLSKIDNVELTVIHGSEKREVGRPAVEDVSSLRFANICLKSSEIKLHPFTIGYQAGVLCALRKCKPDTVIILAICGTISNWFIAIWSKLKGKRVIMWTCAWEPQAKNSIAYKIKKIFLKVYYKMADCTLVYNSKARQSIMQLGIKPDKIRICYNGIETDQMIRNESTVRRKAIELRAKEHCKNRTVFLYVGGMLKEKRVDLLLHAFKNLPQDKVSLWLIGDGPAMREYQNLSQELSLKNVKFWGRIIQEVDQFFAAADFFVLPGVGGLALNQAMFWEVPCIVSEADGTEEDLVFHGVTGYRFQKDSLESLTSCLQMAVYAKSEERQEMGQRARKLILERSNVDEMVRTFESVLRP
jgi:glycosyltransferase involved in cell wall biosynthesis